MNYLQIRTVLMGGKTAFRDKHLICQKLDASGSTSLLTLLQLETES